MEILVYFLNWLGKQQTGADIAKFQLGWRSGEDEINKQKSNWIWYALLAIIMYRAYVFYFY